MLKSEFITAMQDIAGQYGETITQEVIRAGNRYLGMYLKKDGVPTPVVNLDMLYERYRDTEDIDDCIDYVIEVLTTEVDPPYDVHNIVNWDWVKGRLYLRLIGKMTDGICRPVADMYQVPYVQFDNRGNSNVQVTPQLLAAWDVSIDEVFDQAESNQELFRPALIDNLADVMGIKEEVPIYIVTTINKVFGAGAILYSDTAIKLRSLLGGDFYILPSSVHEMLVLPKSMVNDTQGLLAIVAAVNNENVAPSDKLTDSVYTYDFANHTLVAVS